MIKEYLEITKNKQLSESEIKYLIDIVSKFVPCNLLVFGLGADTEIWKELNKSGKTIFIEHNQDWIDKFEGIEVHKVEYWTKRCDYFKDIHSKDLMLDLSDEILNTKWDIIFVDSPEGAEDWQYGRLQSIYSAIQLNPNHLFVHDCNRISESISIKTWTDEFNAFQTRTLKHIIL